MHTWGAARDLIKVHILANGLAPGVHLEDAHAPLHVWPLDSDLPVKPARPQQCAVQNLHTVRRGA